MSYAKLISALKYEVIDQLNIIKILKLLVIWPKFKLTFYNKPPSVTQTGIYKLGH